MAEQRTVVPEQQVLPIIDSEAMEACRSVSKEWQRYLKITNKSLVYIRPKDEDKTAQDILSTMEYDLNNYSKSTNNQANVCMFVPHELFYADLENDFIDSVWNKVPKTLEKIGIALPLDSSASFDWPTVKLDNLREITVMCTNKRRSDYKDYAASPCVNTPMRLVSKLLGAARNCKVLIIYSVDHRLTSYSFMLRLPPALEEIDIPLVEMTEDEKQRMLQNGGKCRINKLSIRAPSNLEEKCTGTHASSMIDMHKNDLKTIKLGVNENVDTNEPTDSHYIHVDFGVKLPRLTELEIEDGNWRIVNISDLQINIPKLKTIKLSNIRNVKQIDPFFSTRSNTVESLSLSFHVPLSSRHFNKLVTSLHAITTLKIDLSKSSNLIKTIFVELERLKTLHVFYHNCDIQTVDKFNCYITGIPTDEYNPNAANIEDFKTRAERSVTCISNLKILEEFKLVISGKVAINVNIWILLTFRHMKNLRRVILSKETLKADANLVMDTADAPLTLSITWI